jgi:Ser/Thr protein kinase RdoA (MazF antagonist)
MELKNIAAKFEIEGSIEAVTPITDGLINDTYLVRTTGTTPDYILQRKNKSIFKDVPGMMDNIRRVTEHIATKVADPLRNVLTVTPTIDGMLYHIDQAGEYWAMCLYISDARTYNKADSPALAEKGGAAIGKFQAQLADFHEPLVDTLPGFHNMRFRFEQWDDVLRRDPVGRAASVQEEIGWIESRREQMMEFWKDVENGALPRRVTHNDTKISNVLFDKDGNSLCVIDLDTVLSACGLNDYGDAIRSYANTGLEDDENLDNVALDWDIFAGFTRGYLSEATFLTPAERKWLAFSALFITFEQVLRFLMDYIDGDNYYKVRDARHNLVRTHAQYKLLQSMEENLPKMNKFVEGL